MYRNKKLKFYIKTKITHTTDEAFYFRFTKAFKMVAGKKMEAQNIGKFIGLPRPQEQQQQRRQRQKQNQ